MKFSQLLLSSLLVATTWAAPKHPLVFFAMVNGNLVPLSSTGLTYRKLSFGLLSYDVLNPLPVEFTLDDKKAYTTYEEYPGHLGTHMDIFGFGEEIPILTFDMDKTSKVLGFNFHSCKVPFGRMRVILTDESSSLPHEDCFSVDIYLLPLDKQTGTPVKQVANPESSGPLQPWGT